MSKDGLANKAKKEAYAHRAVRRSEEADSLLSSGRYILICFKADGSIENGIYSSIFIIALFELGNYEVICNLCLVYNNTLLKAVLQALLNVSLKDSEVQQNEDISN